MKRETAKPVKSVEECCKLKNNRREVFLIDVFHW